MNASGTAGFGRDRILLVDTHVHIYDVFDLDVLFDSAVKNFTRAAQAAGVADAPQEGMLLLTETAADHAFDALASGKRLPLRWKISATLEPAVLAVTNPAQMPLWLVAGRQIATQEDLEVLALGTTQRFPDGEPFQVSIAKAERSAALTALPWGFGKWWGQRGVIIEKTMRAPRDRALFLGDNGGRLSLTARPRLLRLGERAGLKVLPGTDPLPFAGQELRVGSFGMLLPEWDSRGRPLEQLVARLVGAPASPAEFGGLTGMATFVRLQIAMQMRKRARRSAAA